jgi:hypothetical protein
MVQRESNTGPRFIPHQRLSHQPPDVPSVGTFYLKWRNYPDRESGVWYGVKRHHCSALWCPTRLSHSTRSIQCQPAPAPAPAQETSTSTTPNTTSRRRRAIGSVPDSSVRANSPTFLYRTIIQQTKAIPHSTAPLHLLRTPDTRGSGQHRSHGGRGRGTGGM